MKKLLLSLTMLFLAQGAFADVIFNYDRGVELYNKNYVEEADKFFDSYINANPNDDNGYYYKAMLNMKMKNKDKASEYFKKAYEMARNLKNIDSVDIKEEDDANLEDYFDMAVMYYDMGDYKEALNYAQMMLYMNHESTSAFFMIAKIAHVTGDNEKAISNLNKAVTLNPALLNTSLAKELGVDKIPDSAITTYSALATKRFYQGDITSAITYLKKYLEFDKTNIDIHNFLIDCYIKQNNMVAAQNALIDAQKVSENNISLVLSQAEIFRLQKEYSKYENSLHRALKINPNSKEALLKLAEYELENKDYKNALKHYENLVNIDDSSYEAYFGYIYCLDILGQDDKAMSLIRKLNNLNKSTSEINYLLARICAHQGNFLEAMDYLSEAIEKEPNQAYYLEAGLDYYVIAKYDEAIDYLKKVTDKNLLADAQEYLVASLIKLKDYKNAKTVLESSGALDKNSIIYKYYLYIILQSESNDVEAQNNIAALLKTKPNNLKENIELAKINYFEGRTLIATKIIDNAIKLYPNSPEGYFEKIKIAYMEDDDNVIRQTLLQMSQVFK